MFRVVHSNKLKINPLNDRLLKRLASNAVEKASSSALIQDVDASFKEKLSTVSNRITNSNEMLKSKEALSFDEVPGPSALKNMAKFWTYIPVFSNQITGSTLQYMLSAGKIFGNQLSWSNNLWLFRWLMNEYGPVVRLHGPFGGDVVLLSRPEHINIVFHNEGPFPVRSNLDSIEKYRLNHRHFKNAGPFLMHGEQWQEMRKAIEQPMQKFVYRKYSKLNEISDEFVTRIGQIRSQQLEVPRNFSDEVYKWTMECLSLILLNQKFEYLCSGGLSSTSEAMILLDSLKGATSAIQKCESGFHLWKFLETPAWKQLVKHCDTIDGILTPYIRIYEDKLRERKSKKTDFDDITLIECLLLKEGTSLDDILTVLLDMLLLGVNMTAHAVIHFIYYLGTNPRAQRKLYDEIKQYPNISKDKLSELSYLRACLKESLRLRPPMPVLSRVLTKDITIYGYKIPKGTFVLLATNLSSLREEHFEDANKFKPERWLDSSTSKEMEVLASIPFGYGPKACLAKELAETQICLLIYKILNRFRIEYHYGDMTNSTKLLSIPRRHLKFRFVDHY